MKTVLELLGQNGERWCTWALALTADEQPVPAEHPGACKWCLEGALRKCYGREGGPGGDAHEKVLRAIQGHPQWAHFERIGGWNDSRERTWPQVRALVEEAGV